MRIDPHAFFRGGWIRGAFLCFLAVTSVRTAHARPEFLVLAKSTFRIVPGGTIDRAACTLCHAASGPPAWNSFGQDVHAALEARNTHVLTSEILRTVLIADSDKDGYTNGEEITADTLPGDPASHPAKHLPGAASGAGVAAAAGAPDQTPNPFSPASILLAKHAQHPLLVHFPIALFIVSVLLDVLGRWRRNQSFVAAAAINLTLAAIAAVFTVASGILAWQLKFEGAPLIGNLLLHFIGGLTTTALIWTLLLIRRKRDPGRLYFALATFGLFTVSATGHLGGVLSGVAN